MDGLIDCRPGGKCWHHWGPALASERAGAVSAVAEGRICFCGATEAKVRENNRVYTSPVVMWLMVWQRLQAQGTLESAVVELLRGLPSSFWPHPCKRLT